MSQPAANVTDYDPYLDEELVMLFSARIAKGAPLGNKPLVVLARALDTSITKDAEKQREQERVENEKLLGTLSYNSRVELVSHTGHEIHIYRPDVVIDAIRSVVQAVRTGQPLGGNSLF